MRRLGLALAGALLTALPAWGAPRILTEDVTRFYKVYDAAGGHPGVDQLEHDYLARGSDGLHQFAKARNVTAERIADNIEKNPQTYIDARACMAALPGVKRRLAASFDRLAKLYPEAKFPPVTLVIGRGRPVGITDASGVLIGLEALCSATFMNPNLEDRFVHNIAHEYGHIQQSAELQALNPGDPGATVLMVALIEGAGEFTAELISGDVGNNQHRAWTKGKEAQIERAFVQDEDKTDLSKWFYNGPGDAAHPGDLGYWVGYRIVKAYYQRAADKHQALRDIFNMRDPRAFLAASGWKPTVPRP
ncbi:MAG: gliding motility protein GldB-related protein [Phenylobacterium sp.]